MTKTVFGLILLFWIALHTSQSAIDLVDFLLIVAALWTAFKAHEMRALWTSFRPYWLWPVWISVVILGFVTGAPVESKVALKLVWEFRWFISFLSFIYLFRKFSWSEIQIRSFSLILLAFSILDVVLFFVDYDKDPRAGGLFGHSMPFAHTMGPAALFLLFVGVKKSLEKAQKPLWRAVYFLAPILASALVVLSFTRGIWIGFTVALLFCAGLMGRKVFASSLLALALTSGLLFYGSNRIQNRVMGKTTAESQSNNERMLYWKANLQIFKDYPWVGIGYSQNNIHVEEYLKKEGVEWLVGTHAHNQYIHFLAGTGLLGLGCFLSFLALVFYPIFKRLLVWRKQKNISDQYYLLMGVFAALLCFVIGSLTESNFSIAKNRFAFLFIAAIGYAMSVGKSSSSENENEC
ncbi:MAG: O-antigen ligase family protein [Pseudobdellovibrionaceae bacterium]